MRKFNNIEEYRLWFGHSLRVCRAKRMLTQKQLADQSGLTVDVISEIETGKRSPTLDTIYKISLALDTLPVLIPLESAPLQEYKFNVHSTGCILYDTLEKKWLLCVRSDDVAAEYVEIDFNDPDSLEFPAVLDTRRYAEDPAYCIMSQNIPLPLHIKVKTAAELQRVISAKRKRFRGRVCDRNIFGS